MSIYNKSCEYKLIETHWIDLHVNDDNLTYFDSFGVEHIPKQIRKIIGYESIITNTYGIQAYDPIMHGYFCIEFIYFMLKGKSSLEYTNLFFPYNYEKSNKKESERI